MRHGACSVYLAHQTQPAAIQLLTVGVNHCGRESRYIPNHGIDAPVLAKLRIDVDGAEGRHHSNERRFSYGTGPRHTLDIYVPEKLTASAPVVVFFYGGGWEIRV